MKRKSYKDMKRAQGAEPAVDEVREANRAATEGWVIFNGRTMEYVTIGAGLSYEWCAHVADACKWKTRVGAEAVRERFWPDRTHIFVHHFEVSAGQE